MRQAIVRHEPNLSRRRQVGTRTGIRSRSFRWRVMAGRCRQTHTLMPWVESPRCAAAVVRGPAPDVFRSRRGRDGGKTGRLSPFLTGSWERTYAVCRGMDPHRWIAQIGQSSPDNGVAAVVWDSRSLVVFPRDVWMRFRKGSKRQSRRLAGGGFP